jgi:hypothetical protein
VRSKLDSGYKAFFDYAAFLGMAPLYQLLQSQNSTTIYYVSNAPSQIMQSRHARFLQQFNFPQSENLRTRSNFTNGNFKIESILALVEQEQPEVLILVGDNGERDPRTFQEVRETLASTPVSVISFIHLVYSRVEEDDAPLEPLTPDQLPYVSPVEMGLQLARLGLIPLMPFYEFADQLIQLTLEDAKKTEESTSFPKWLDCSAHRWHWPEGQDEPIRLPLLKDLISRRCNVDFQP